MNQKILKYRFIIEVIISMLLIFTYIYEISGRHFLCFSNGKCVTTWENSGGLIIIPYKYYGLTIPQKFVRASYGNTGAGAYITTIKSSKDKKYSFVVDSDKLENHTHGIICTSPHGHIDLTSDEVFMINTGVEVVGHGTIIERWKGTKKETIAEPFFFFQNAYIPIYVVFGTVFFFRYITEATIIKKSDQNIKSIMGWLLKMVAEILLVMLAIIGISFILFLVLG